MQHRPLPLFAATLAAVSFFAFGPRASADTLSGTVVLEYKGNDGVFVQQATLNGMASSPTYFPAPLGEFHWGNPPGLPNQQIVNTFCAELTRHGANALPPIGGDAAFKVGDLSALHGATSATITGAQVQAIEALYGNNYNFSADKANGTLGTVSDNAAFQLALWEILYDNGNPHNLSGGNFYVNDSAFAAIKTEAESMLNQSVSTGLANYNASGYEVVSLIGTTAKGAGNYQDQITVQPKPVPAPPALMLAGIGVLGLIGRARWNRKAATA